MRLWSAKSKSGSTGSLDRGRDVRNLLSDDHRLRQFRLFDTVRKGTWELRSLCFAGTLIDGTLVASSLTASGRRACCNAVGLMTCIEAHFVGLSPFLLQPEKSFVWQSGSESLACRDRSSVFKAKSSPLLPLRVASIWVLLRC